MTETTPTRDASPAPEPSPSMQPGTGNGFEAEAMPGALPVGRNAPRGTPEGDGS